MEQQNANRTPVLVPVIVASLVAVVVALVAVNRTVTVDGPPNGTPPPGEHTGDDTAPSIAKRTLRAVASYRERPNSDALVRIRENLDHLPEHLSTVRIPAPASTPTTFSDDGRWLVRTSRTEVSLYDSAAGALRASAPIRGRVRAVEASPFDHLALLLERPDGAASVKILALSGGTVVERLEHPVSGWSEDPSDQMVAFSPRGRYLVTTETAPPGSAGKMVLRITDLRDREVVHSVTRPYPISAVRFVDEAHIAIVERGDESDLLTLVRWQTGRVLDTLSVVNRVHRLDGNAHGPELAVASVRAVSIYRMDGASLEHVVSLNAQGRPTEMRFSQAGKYLAMSVGHQGTTVHDLRTGRIAFTVAETIEVDALAWGPSAVDGELLTAHRTGDSTELNRWHPPRSVSVRKRWPRPLFRVSDARTAQVGLSKDGATALATVALGDDEPWMMVYSTDGERIQSVFSMPLVGQAAALHPSGNLLAIDRTHGEVEVRALDQPDPVFVDRTAAGPDTSELDLAFDPSGRILVAFARAPDATAHVRIWQPTTGQRIATFDAGPTQVHAISPDGRRIATATPEGLSLWDTDTGQRVFVVDARADQQTDVDVVRHIVFSPNGQWLAYSAMNASLEYRVDVRAVHGLVRRSTRSIAARVEALRFSPDGRWLAVASDDRRVRVLDRGTLTERYVAVLDTPANAIAFDATGHRMAVADDDGAVQLWRLRPRFERIDRIRDLWPERILIDGPRGHLVALGAFALAIVPLDVDRLLSEAENRLAHYPTVR